MNGIGEFAVYTTLVARGPRNFKSILRLRFWQVFKLCSMREASAGIADSDISYSPMLYKDRPSLVYDLHMDL
jgi:hypothetical protein